MTQEKILIVMPTLGEHPHIQMSINTLYENNHKSLDDIEVYFLLVANGEKAVGSIILPPDKWKASIKVFAENMGVTYAWNYGLERAVRYIDADYVMIVNDDVHFGPNVLKACIEGMRQGHYLVYPANDEFRRDVRNRPLPPDFDKLAEAAAKEPVVATKKEDFAGWAFCLSKKCLDEVGWFDPRFILWYQDTDYLMRLRMAKKLPAEMSGCLMHHYQEQTMMRMDGDRAHKGWIAKDEELFFRKYPSLKR